MYILTHLMGGNRMVRESTILARLFLLYFDQLRKFFFSFLIDHVVLRSCKLLFFHFNFGIFCLKTKENIETYRMPKIVKQADGLMTW